MGGWFIGASCRTRRDRQASGAGQQA